MSSDNPRDTAPTPHRRPSGSPSRKLTKAARFRATFRKVADRVLGADLGWSVAFLVLVTLALASQRCGVASRAFQPGDAAPQDIVVPRDLEVVDETLTEARRQSAREAVPDVYAYDSQSAQRVVAELDGLFLAGRAALRNPPPGRSRENAARDALEGRVPAPALRYLIRKKFPQELESQLAGILRRVMRGIIVGNKALVEPGRSILVVRLPEGATEEIHERSAILDLDEARIAARRETGEKLDLPAPEKAALAELVTGLVDTNTSYDRDRTDERRKAAAAAVLPVLVKVPRGTVLVRQGEKITPEILARLDAMRRASNLGLGLPDVLGLFTLVGMLTFFLKRYTGYHQRRFRKIRHLHALLVLVTLATLALALGMLWLVRAVVDNLRPPFNNVDLYVYLIPVGAGPILVALLANGRIAMVSSTFTAVLLGAAVGWDFHVMLWALVVQWAAVYAISAYRERAALLRAGLVVGGTAAAAALAVDAVRGMLQPSAGALYGAALAFVGGAVGVGLLISFALPLFEQLFNVLTDIRLLELSNVNHPLLSELAVKAPGSYNHSLVVGTLAEEAAKAVGANSLFCRVAAFYHDIGKILKPAYYVENQRLDNPHDRLSPSMSALVISAHVKDGIRLAREAGLPEQIVDIIPQHHGTRLMTYFYEKAKKAGAAAGAPVKEEDFRYPGPKPQSREAAIFMLADAVEAAARTVEDPTPNRLREMIRKVSGAIVLDGQLDDCDLTFADLEHIQQAFLRVLVSMHHHRVEYPGYEFARPRRRNGDAAARTPARKI